jgi:hypothetical protein
MTAEIAGAAGAGGTPAAPADRTGESVGAVTAGELAAAPTPAAVPDKVSPGKSPRAQAYNELYSLARLTTNTAMVPRPLRGRPDEAFAVMVYGAELGLEPMAAMRSIFLIEGQPTCSAQLMRALIQAAGHMLAWREVGESRVVLYGRRRDTGADTTVTWTLDDARRAKLAGKGNWATYPRAMLAARATSEIARLLFADVLHGIAYTPEEVGAVGPYAAIDVDWQPPDDDDDSQLRYVNRDTGEVFDDDTPAHVVQAAVLDAEDAMDAEWLAEARADPGDTVDGRVAQADLDLEGDD